MPRAEIFANTGIQFMQINTLYQLLAMSLRKSPLLDVAKTFVTIPDLFNYWLSGEISMMRSRGLPRMRSLLWP
jgi:rhamnulokinase